MTYNRKTVAVIESADSQVISISEMKNFLRVDGSADDEIVFDYINTAVEMVKQYTRRGILTETLVYRADGFVDPSSDDRMAALGPGTHTASVPFYLSGANHIDLPFPPLQSVTSIVTYDRGNNASTFDADAYEVDLQSGRIYLNSGRTWPTDLRDNQAVEVTYVAGYGSVNIPAPIKEALRLYVSSLYDGTCEGINAQMQRLLAPYRLADDLPW